MGKIIINKFNSFDIIKAFKDKGYDLDETVGGINIFGIRNSNTLTNDFDDVIGLLWFDRHTRNWLLKLYPGTTDPGMYYRLNPMNIDGTAIIVPMQHKKSHKVGKHTGYEAMEQCNPMGYVRDSNRDKILDFLYKKTGFKLFKQNGKTNIHKAGSDSKLVDKWSAGCQVIAKESHFEEFMKLIKESIYYKNNKDYQFDYTLFEIEDFDMNRLYV